MILQNTEQTKPHYCTFLESSRNIPIDSEAGIVSNALSLIRALIFTAKYVTLKIKMRLSFVILIGSEAATFVSKRRILDRTNASIVKGSALSTRSPKKSF